MDRLGPRKLASMTAPVIFENRIAASTLGPLIGAISGPSVARGVSFLKTRRGEPVFSAAPVVAPVGVVGVAQVSCPLPPSTRIRLCCRLI